MFKTCIYCNRNLGDNEVVEDFPIGRRLAFDQERGRLWVICENCRRWNLSPLEERWEAIEECERRFYDTPKSYSTDNIGLAQVSEGLQLVRIGRPQRREFAAWRYGREFWQRRVLNVVAAAVQVAIGIGTAIAGANLLPLIFGIRANRVVARVRDEKGGRLFLTPVEVKRLKLFRADAEDGWALSVHYRPDQRRFLFWSMAKGKRQETELAGATAIRAAGHILPRLNEYGGTDSQVRKAVTLIEEARAPERLFHSVAAERGALVPDRIFDRDATELKNLDANVRLALEMAAHEESERCALEGELAILEEAWREAEEIASIADRLLIPESVEEWIRKHR
ncbi:MAG: hypothetical protein JSW46_02930 [Gemmatimonadota bacterium]|nr:MAG: hypothetical protein JSW46_02930 [Gemmatimonadota bacterium]